MTDDVIVREATDADEPGILELLSASLQWDRDERFESFFRWKHYESPFGPSPAWVALVGDRVVGFRVWLRWRFVQSGEQWEAVRAVDTATHPDFQGRGIFRRLTMQSIECLRERDVAHVFNTPNDNSRPGYLKMGWEQVGELPVVVRFRSPAAAVRAARSRASSSAERWSIPTELAQPADEVLSDAGLIDEFIKARPDDGAIRTKVDAEFLRWRYGFGPLHYRGVLTDGGLALFRLRRRGTGVECVVGNVLATSRRAEQALITTVAKESKADQMIRLSFAPVWWRGEFALPGGGPVLTWRAVNETRMPPLQAWDLTMGDIELF